MPTQAGGILTGLDRTAARTVKGQGAEVCRGVAWRSDDERNEYMSDTTRDSFGETGDAGVQPLRDGDTSIEPDAAADPAQAEWDATTALDEGAEPDDIDAATATGADPAEIPAPDDDIPAQDLRPASAQPESQGDDPTLAALGEDGQGDIAPEDL